MSRVTVKDVSIDKNYIFNPGDLFKWIDKYIDGQIAFYTYEKTLQQIGGSWSAWVDEDEGCIDRLLIKWINEGAIVKMKPGSKVILEQE